MLKALFNLNPVSCQNSILTLLCIWFISYPIGIWALSTDKDQDIEVTADRADLNDQEKIAIYYDDVIVIQGSIYMTGDKLTVHYDEDGEMELAIMEGQPATYKQLPDNSAIYDKAKALKMEYYEPKELLILINNAEVIQEDKILTGHRINYQTDTNHFKATSIPDEDADTSAQTAATTEKPRVQFTIKSKKSTSSSADKQTNDAATTGTEPTDP